MSVVEFAKLPSEHESYFSIAVIGAGASAVAFVNSLVESTNLQSSSRIKLTLFEKGETVGRGVAYQEDLDSLLINRPAGDMSVCVKDRNHFVKWLFNNKEYYQMFEESEFLPRRIFGEYLTETLDSCMARAQKSIQFEILYKEVSDLNKRNDGRYELYTEDGQVLFYDFVLLSVGGAAPDAPYQLSGKSGYIHSAFPVKETLSGIGPKETVAILGSRLTGIDIAVSLRYQNHEGSIYMISRSGKIPAVRGKERPYKAKYFTPQNLNHFLVKHQYVSFRYMAKLLRKELKSVGYDWREVLFKHSEKPDDEGSVSQNIAANQWGSPWFNILREAHEIADQFWGYVPIDQKQMFKGKFKPSISNRIASFPIVNAERINSLLQTKQLQLLKDIDSIQKRGHKFYIKLYDREIECDYIINATGPSEDLSKNGLIKNLLSKGYLAEDPNGGIKVDYNSTSVIDSDGVTNPSLRAIGHFVNGTYLFINNIRVITHFTHYIAEDVCRLIKDLDIMKHRESDKAVWI